MLYTRHVPSVRLSSKVLDVDSFESLASHIHELLCLELDHLFLDLTSVTFIYPAAAIELVMLCKFICSRKDCIPVIKFGAGAVYSYLENIGAIDLLHETAEIVDTPRSRGRSMARNNALSEQDPTKRIMLVSQASLIPPLLESIDGYLCKRLGYSKTSALDMCIILSELLHNVLDHNPKDTFALFLVGVYGRPTESLLTLAIGDAGVGILTSLRRNPRYQALVTDTEAILTAIRFGSSEFADQSRGNGLFFALKMLTDRGGFGRLRSGKARLRFRPRHPRKQVGDVAFLPGTVFSASLPSLYRQRSLSMKPRLPESGR